MDYYKILGVKDTSTQKEIKDAYRTLAKKYHPDTYKGNKESAEAKMKEINEAYDTLFDKEKRMMYDDRNGVKENIYSDYNDNFYTQDMNKVRNPQTYYNYSPYTEEENYYHRHSSNYNIDFSSIKKQFNYKFKYVALAAIFIVVTGIIALVMITKLLINTIKGITENISPSYSTLKPGYYNKGTASEEQTKDIDMHKSVEEWQKNTQEAIEKYKESSQEWYDTEGKEYEKQLSELLLELERQINEELEKTNN